MSQAEAVTPTPNSRRVRASQIWAVQRIIIELAEQIYRNHTQSDPNKATVYSYKWLANQFRTKVAAAGLKKNFTDSYLTNILRGAVAFETHRAGHPHLLATGGYVSTTNLNGDSTASRINGLMIESDKGEVRVVRDRLADLANLFNMASSATRKKSVSPVFATANAQAARQQATAPASATKSRAQRTPLSREEVMKRAVTKCVSLLASNDYDAIERTMKRTLDSLKK